MNTIIKFLVFSFLFFFMTACQSVKNTLSMKKEKTTDEFLIEKKNPLVLPPDYSELPVPKNEKNIIEKENESIDLSKVLKKSDKKEEIKNTKNLEKTILDKIEKK
tara:strand:- start:32 stop:346 length:315 start_codon:yes stop_codon:yes gene_type:complete